MKITLLHPSRGRADKALATYLFWIAQSSKIPAIQIEHIVSIDVDDPEAEKYAANFKNVPGSAGIKYPNVSVVEATNRAARFAEGDILVYLSDDFKCPKNWDIELCERIKPDAGPTLLKVNDCLQPFHVAVLTIPIMNRALLNELQYFWHPGYRSMFVDEDLFWTCKNNGWIVDAGDLEFPHEHPANNKAPNDETYIRSAANWDSGKAFYAERKLKNFPLHDVNIFV